MDIVDKKFGWEGTNKANSWIRRLLHGSYHIVIGFGKGAILNFRGMRAEMIRAKQQFFSGKDAFEVK